MDESSNGGSLETPIRIIIIGNSVNRFKAIATFLGRRGITTSVFSDVKKAIDVVSKSRPDFVLLSWNLKGAGAPKLADLIQSALKISVIAIAEDPDQRTAASLSVSRIKEVIHAPVSGPVILMRIQKLLKERPEREAEMPTASVAQVTTPKPEEAKLSAASASRLDNKKGVWVQRGKRQGKAVWHFKMETPEAGHPNGRYYYFGENAPTQSKTGEWAIQPGELFYSEQKEEELGLVDPSPAIALKAHLRKITEDVFSYAWKEYAPEKENRVRGVGAFEILSADLNGLLVVSSLEADSLSQEKLAKIDERLKERVFLFGRGLKIANKFNVPVKPTKVFREWSRSKCDFCFDGKFDSENLSIAFLEIGEKSNIAPAGEASRGKVGISLDVLFPNEEVPFDVFVDLPANNKFIKLVKQGTILHGDRLERLKLRKVSQVFVDVDAIQRIPAYRTANLINSSLEEFIDQGLGKPSDLAKDL